MMRAVIKLLLLVIFISSVVYAQTLTEEQRRQLDNELRRATPQEIQERLRQVGISKEEAIRRARDEGISLEDYLFQRTPPLGIEVPVEKRLAPDTVDILKDEREIPVRHISTQFHVPEFSDREKAKNLDAFGYNIFRLPPSTFEPVLNIPPPPNYRLGPGDELVITVWGEVQFYHVMTINRDGYIILPDVGQVIAAGFTLEEMRKRLLQRMSRVYSSLANGQPDARSYLELSLGKLRTIQVFVLGDVNQPGGYTLSSMSTAFQALYLSGGPSIKGSMRSIRVIRDNNDAVIIDFYQYALRGDQSKDVRLEDGDIVFVPPAGKRVALAGSVVRSAIYELDNNESLGDLIQIAGGVRFNAYIDRLHIERIVPFAQRRDFRYSVLDIDLRFENLDNLLESDYRLEPGDIVTVFSREQRLQNRVSVVGNVFKPGVYELYYGMRINDLIEKADGLLDDTFVDRGTLVRTRDEDLRREIMRFDLELAISGDPEHNIELKRLDEVYIYSKGYFFPQHTVTISGEVRNPGTFIRAEGMTVEDLIVLAGGATEEAMLSQVTVSRIDTANERNYAEVYTLAIPERYWEVKNNPHSFYIIDFDHVTVPSDPRLSKQRFVEVRGEVRFPGRYAVQDDEERLASIIDRVGGLKESAYPEGMQYFRNVDGIDILLPLSLTEALRNPSSSHNVLVRDGDRIEIPDNPQVVIVRGEVNVPVAVKYVPGSSLKYYINQAGGYTKNADKKRTTVMLPSGIMWERSGWFYGSRQDILAGSVINVPMKEPREGRTMEIVRDWSMLMVSTAAIIVSIVQITK